MIQEKKNNYLNDLIEIKQLFQQWIDNINKLIHSNQEQIIQDLSKSINRMKKFMMIHFNLNLQEDKTELIQQNQDYCAQLIDFETLQEQYWNFSDIIQDQQTIKQYKELKKQNINKIRETKKSIFTQPSPMSVIIKQIPAIFQGYLNKEKQTISGRFFLSQQNQFIDCFLINNQIKFQMRMSHGILLQTIPQIVISNIISNLQEVSYSQFDSDDFNKQLNQMNNIEDFALNSYKNLKAQFKQKIQKIEAQIFSFKQPQLFHQQFGLFYGMIDDIKNVISGRILILTQLFLCDFLVIDDQIEFQISIMGENILLEKDENKMFPFILENVKNSLEPINNGYLRYKGQNQK